MIDLSNVTLVSVASVRVDKTIKALKYSSKDITFGDIKLITHESVIEPGITVINVDRMDYEQYNKFIVFELYKYIDTDYALIIQDDGFVVNPNEWKPEFLNYDYIGAPWPLPYDDFSYRDAFNNLIRVGNGGFSLRSKKILSLADKLNLEWKSYFGYYNEDGFFTCHNRHIYEQNGCVFAPLDVAKYFSHEIQIPETEGITPFGFHGKGNSYNGLI
jgi:hypothetical protein